MKNLRPKVPLHSLYLQIDNAFGASCSDFYSYNTRNCNKLVLPTNRLARTNSEEIKIYNGLPDELRSLQLSRFKCKLKPVLTRACIYSFEEYYALARDRQAFLTKLNA
ncbi:unnamed protein product [Acanthoscelides obtectus]|uniref:Uncharacterized protein n=1 Tax=Acanthoscelides obtectus TaxID=200917 RepID=A0A9P0KWQ6_ACAOB|nr:unnamed protein product [Acanthoscelides obtectus]CAK1673165.1 hypothetical protein AOBTE_LOCUS29255 [Acanthoscelides obtectus]